jgi:hypothetical protein
MFGNIQVASAAQLQRTRKGLSFDRFRESLYGMMDSGDPAARAKYIAANDAFLKGIANPRFSDPRSASMDPRLKALTPANVHVDRVLSSFSIAYQNDNFIGTRLFPVLSVSNRSDKYAKFSKRDRMSVPDDRIGHRSSANEVEQNFTYDNFSVSDYGLKEYTDYETIKNADDVLREMLGNTEFLNQQIAFSEEARIVAIAENSANYGATSASAVKWDHSSGGDIIAKILAAKAALWSGPSPTKLVGFTTLEVWNAGIINNPTLKALYAGVRDGLVTTEIVASYFGLDEILIAEGRRDNANEGQAASYGKMWSADNFGVARVAVNPTKKSLCWGVTFREVGDPFTSQWNDPSIGKRGGLWNRVSISEDHKVVAPDAAYLITDVLT